jgi:Tfp pilus assembly protein FimT
MNQVANKQAGFATRWLLIIVVILALIGGFAFYESQKENTPQTDQEPETALTEEARRR